MVRKRGVARKSFARRRVRRVKKYDCHVTPLRFKKYLPRMADLLEPKLAVEVGCETPTMELLDTLGVPLEEYPYYLGFMKRMIVLYRNFTSETLASEKESLIEEYVLRDKDRDVLEQVQEVAANCAEAIFELMVLVFRDYWHWFIDFNDLTDFENDTDGTAYTTVDNTNITLQTGATQDSVNLLYHEKIIGTYITTWEKERVFQAIMAFGGAEPINSDIHIVTGYPPDYDAFPIDYHNHFGFRILRVAGVYRLYGTVGNSAAVTTLDLGTITSSDLHSLVASLTPNEKVDFYLDGVLKGSITTTLPSGELDSGILLAFKIKNLAALDESVNAYYWEMWQKRPSRLLG